MKALEKLTFDRVTVRAVSIPMRRPIVAKVGTYPEWPFILDGQVVVPDRPGNGIEWNEEMVARLAY